MHRKILCSTSLSLVKTASKRLFSVSSTNNARVGFIGLGNMGQHMAGYVQKGGHPLVLYDTNPESYKKFQNAEIASSPAELASKVDRVITMIPTPKDVLQVYLGEGGVVSGAKKGTLLVDSSTIDPGTAKQVEAAAKKNGLEFVDAPVTGAVPGARGGTLTFLVGAEQANFDTIKPLLQTMGKNIIHCGPVGAGQVAKICNNMMLAITMIGTSETLNLGARLGLDPKLLTQILNISSGRSWVTESYNPAPGIGDAALPSNNQYNGGFGVKLMAKDLTLAQSIAVESQSPTPMGALAAQIYRIMTNNGFGDKDMSFPYQFLKQTKDV